jgi:prevent-host-death family protein
MRIVNMHEAKTQLSKLVELAAQGQPFVIARAGKPLVKVAALDPVDALAPPPRLGFLLGEFSTPDDFDTIAQDEIAALFS